MNSPISHLNQLPPPSPFLQVIENIKKKKKKNSTLNDLRKSSRVKTCVLVSSVWICHHYYVRESQFQLGRLPPAVSSLVHEGLVLPLVGDQSQEHFILPLIEADESMKCRKGLHTFVPYISVFIVIKHSDFSHSEVLP